MIRFHGQAATHNAGLLIGRLCRHFHHKGSIETMEDGAQVRFDFGQCRMRAVAEHLLLDCQVADEPAGQRMRFVLEDHLLRFARHETLQLEWQAAPLEDDA
ncbi:cytochrome b561 [Pseudomonas sp. BAY1663]|uniref:DUF2218 domain-containing protein n=1 Tax=Stutzerimonas stutzeri TaxID=316 RepID=A0A2N8T8I9_STUST|nr:MULTISPECIES: DUF2218 domain-containing protein [Pseudomonadaceae]EXF46955.1 cytochrome b561 [Pseudomonas sp. BAY1663]MCQ4324663.1 DUF2218 domain-containing protein [Stutzerimonas stutzeri]PNG11074.1 DUF2218 domain-containing protein [Stutzerimonas stutzeri]